MWNEEYIRLEHELVPRGYSFLVVQGEHLHTCDRTFDKLHPAYTDESHCGRCWCDMKGKDDE